MDQFISTIPQSRPLRPDGHVIVAESGVHMLDGVLKDNTGFQRAVLFIQPVCKYQGAKDRIQAGGDRAFKLDFDCQRDMWGGGDGWGIRD